MLSNGVFSNAQNALGADSPLRGLYRKPRIIVQRLASPFHLMLILFDGQFASLMYGSLGSAFISVEWWQS
jgi:hypothetical protein